MTILKLVEADGSILGGIVIPDRQVAALFQRQELVLHYVDPPSISFSRSAPPDIANVHRIVIIAHSSRDDAVMLAQGDLWNFEKVPGCFFIPGYAMTMAGRR
jgi:hypothetical protein